MLGTLLEHSGALQKQRDNSKASESMMSGESVKLAAGCQTEALRDKKSWTTDYRGPIRVAGLSVIAGGMLGDGGSKEHGMEGHRWSCSGEWRSSLVARLQRPFELVPREVLSDGQL